MTGDMTNDKPFRKTGEAAISESPLHPRRQSRRIMVGPVPVGGGAPISVQSMTNTPTVDVSATLQQIAELTAAGCDIVRVAVPSQDDADALPEIVRKSPIPVIADIHFQSRYVFQAIDAGCAAVRVNPGNIRKFDEVGPAICKAATDAGISLRIGVNAGSLDKELYAKYGGPTPEALVASALKEARMFEDVGFHDFKISVKHHDPITMVQTYRLLASKGDWPLHLGVTEAGPAWQGTIKSCLAFGALLAEGIGDTIRVSLSAPPVEEVKVGCKILEYLGLRPRRFDIISCPSCGRAQVDVIQLANAVTEGLKDVTAPIRVAVVGCEAQKAALARDGWAEAWTVREAALRLMQGGVRPVRSAPCMPCGPGWLERVVMRAVCLAGGEELSAPPRFAPERGFSGVKTARFSLLGREVQAARVCGAAQMERLLRTFEPHALPWQVIEVLVCAGGCDRG